MVSLQLNVRQYSTQNIIATTTTTYNQLTVNEDLALNGRLIVSGRTIIRNGDLSLNQGRLFVNGDASLNGNLEVGKDITILGRLNVKNFTSQNIINTTTNNYQLIVSEDLSLNGRFYAKGNVMIGSGNEPSYLLDVSSVSSAPFRVGVGATNALVVNSTGLVGIGKTNPTVALDVVGNVRCTAGIDLNYSALPTFASNQIGYIINTSSVAATNASMTSELVAATFSDVPIGVWLCSVYLITYVPAGVGPFGGSYAISSTSTSVSNTGDISNVLGTKYGLMLSGPNYQTHTFTFPFRNDTARNLYFKLVSLAGGTTVYTVNLGRLTRIA